MYRIRTAVVPCYLFSCLRNLRLWVAAISVTESVFAATQNVQVNANTLQRQPV